MQDRPRSFTSTRQRGSAAVLTLLLMLLLMLLLIPGVRSEAVVRQPAVVSAAVGGDVRLPCELHLSGESLKTTPVFYWSLWRGEEKGVERWADQSDGRTPTGQPLLLRGVSWADGGSYLCKVSLRTDQNGSYRKNGNKTKLLLYDELLFKRCMNQTQLCCQGNVTQDAAFSLSVLHDGQTLPADAAAVADAAAAQAQAFTLSRVAPLQGAGRYECQLLLGGGLMTKSLLILNETEAGGGGANTTSSLPSVGVNPEPWLLYGTVLLVPVAVLLVLLTVQMSSRLKEPPEEEC